jgi:hypothetical protein
MRAGESIQKGRVSPFSSLNFTRWAIDVTATLMSFPQSDTFSFCGRQNQTVLDKMTGSGNNSRGWLCSHGLHEYTNTVQLPVERGKLRCLSG